MMFFILGLMSGLVVAGLFIKYSEKEKETQIKFLQFSAAELTRMIEEITGDKEIAMSSAELAKSVASLKVTMEERFNEPFHEIFDEEKHLELKEIK